VAEKAAVEGEFHEVQESLDMRPEAEDEFNVEGVIRRNVLLLLHPVQPAYCHSYSLSASREPSIPSASFSWLNVQSQDPQDVKTVLIRTPAGGAEDRVAQCMLLG
jgi:hypothetical protein